MSTPVEEAILRAKAIAARLAASSSAAAETPAISNSENNVYAVLDAAFPSHPLDPSHAGASSVKRKRWGVDGNTASANGGEGTTNMFEIVSGFYFCILIKPSCFLILNNLYIENIQQIRMVPLLSVMPWLWPCLQMLINVSRTNPCLHPSGRMK
jgi:hypothetical protein